MKYRNRVDSSYIGGGITVALLVSPKGKIYFQIQKGKLAFSVSPTLLNKIFTRTNELMKKHQETLT